MLSRLPVYIVFQRGRGNDIEEMFVSSPCFEDEIEDILQLFEEEDGLVEVLSEEIFSKLYSVHYINEKTFAWVDFLDTFVNSLVGIEIEYFEISEDGESVETNLFSITREGEELFLYFNILTDPLIISILTLEIHAYFLEVYSLNIRSMYYFSKKEGKIFLDDSAKMKLELENTFFKISPN